MMITVNPLSVGSMAKSPLGAGQADTATSTGGKSFSQMLVDAAQQVNDLQNTSAAQSQLLATGQTSDIQSVMISAQKATIALELSTQVRNRMLEAYQEVMKMNM